MTTHCDHKNLLLLAARPDKLRCRHCHLTLTADELGNSHCPECFEATGKRRYAFEPVAAPVDQAARYRCEDCGIFIETDG